MKVIQDAKPDLIFLDIQMPKINGFELLDLIDPCPEIIFTTAYDQYALKAFEKNAVDYLLKPFSRERFEQALDKAFKKISEKQARGNEGIDRLKDQIDAEPMVLERVIVRSGSKIIVIPVDQLWYFEAQDDYVMIHSEMGKHLKEKTMKYFMQHLPPGRFIQIHRSYIVNIDQIVSMELYEKNTHLVTLKCGAKLRASQEGYKRLRQLL
jgi:two-component system LytT family response regulator